MTGGFGRGAHLSGVVDLRNFVDGEILCVDSAGKLGLERSTDLAQTVPVDAVKERMVFKLLCAANMAKTILVIAD